MKDSILLKKADKLAHLVYKKTKTFPKEEIFSLTSQLRRAAISIPLNIIEGFARNSRNDFKRFLLISFGSLKESKYLLNFSYQENYLSKDDYQALINLADEVVRILWTLIEKIKVG